MELIAAASREFFVAAKLLMPKEHTSNRTSVVLTMADLRD